MAPASSGSSARYRDDRARVDRPRRKPGRCVLHACHEHGRRPLCATCSASSGGLMVACEPETRLIPRHQGASPRSPRRRCAHTPRARDRGGCSFQMHHGGPRFPGAAAFLLGLVVVVPFPAPDQNLAQGLTALSGGDKSSYPTTPPIRETTDSPRLEPLARLPDDGEVEIRRAKLAPEP